MSEYTPRFAGDIKIDPNNYNEEYVRIAQFLDKFLPNEPVKTYKVSLTDSNKATYETLEIIKKLIEEGKKDYVVRRTAEKIIQYLPPKAYEKEVDSIYNFVIRRLRYTKDIDKVETVHRARDLLRFHRKAADCDDFVILTGALLQAIGHPIRLVIIGNNHKDKEDYSHIYLQTYINKRWIALDGSVPNAKPGWEAPQYATKKIIDFEGSETLPDRKPQIYIWLLLGFATYYLLK